LKPYYEKMLKDYEQRLENIRRLFKEPPEDEDLTMQKAMSLLLGASPERVAMMGSGKQISRSAAARQRRKEGVLE
jgi:hypothetical protein